MPGSRRRGGTRTRTRSDACPGAWRRHDAADGALARFRPVGGAVSAAELRVLAGAALGGGSALEVTSRGSLQVRGLDPRTADDLADALRRLPSSGAPLLDTEGRDVPCTVLASVRTPVADAAARHVADALRGREDVPGRLLVAVDDGSGDVAAERADVAVVVGEPATLLLDGVDSGLCHPDAATLALAAVEAFLAVRGDAWRLADLDDGVARVAEHLRCQQRGVTGSQRRQSRFADIGSGHRTDLGVGDDGVVEVMPRLGELDLATVGVLVDLLDGLLDGPGGTLRITPRRTLVLRDLADPHAALARLDGLVETRPGSPWATLSACVGAPRCAKAHADVRGALTAAVGSGHAGGGRVPAHWIGCHRGCGTPGGRVAVVEALPTGGYRTVVRAGRVSR